MIPILPPTCILHSPALTLRNHRLLVGSWFLVIYEFNGLLKIHDLQPGRCFMKEIDSIPWSVLIGGFRTQLHGFTGSMEFSWQAMLGDGIGPCAPERCILDWMWRHDHHVENLYIIYIYICIKTYQDNDKENRDVGMHYLMIRRWSWQWLMMMLLMMISMIKLRCTYSPLKRRRAPVLLPGPFRNSKTQRVHYGKW